MIQGNRSAIWPTVVITHPEEITKKRAEFQMPLDNIKHNANHKAHVRNHSWKFS